MRVIADAPAPKMTLDVQFGDWVYRHHDTALLTETRPQTRTHVAAYADVTRTLVIAPPALECCRVDLRLIGETTYTGLGTPDPVVLMHSSLPKPPCGHWTYWRPPAT